MGLALLLRFLGSTADTFGSKNKLSSRFKRVRYLSVFGSWVIYCGSLCCTFNLGTIGGCVGFLASLSLSDFNAGDMDDFGRSLSLSIIFDPFNGSIFIFSSSSKTRSEKLLPTLARLPGLSYSSFLSSS